MSQKDHWEQAYASKPTEKQGWYEAHLRTSTAWIKDLGLADDAPILDVGGGASTLVDDLLEASHRAITVLDISEKALSSARTRLGAKAELVAWLHGDITSVDLPTNFYAVWHDRAAFHFLILPEQQKKYLDNLLKSLKPDGHLILGTFASEAPTMCSGLPVQRYSPEKLESILGGGFELSRHQKELHVTPGGAEQMYLYCHFRRTA